MIASLPSSTRTQGEKSEEPYSMDDYVDELASVELIEPSVKWLMIDDQKSWSSMTFTMWYATESLMAIRYFAVEFRWRTVSNMSAVQRT